MKKSIFLIIMASIALGGCTQSSSQKKGSSTSLKIKIGGGCESCEAIHESPQPFDKLSHQAWLPDWNDKGTRLEVSGIAYNADGSPAPGVVIYVYHTDQNGIYPTHGNESGWGKRHGYLRGWMKTNEKGEYKFYTLRPAAYPGRKDPAHIHVTIKEPDKNEYWIDEFVFEDDPLLTAEQKKNLEDRGGSGILSMPSRSEGINLLKYQ